eukprot:scaffold33779_cov50-Prasinocladus_malaysianus.AAC.5
MGQSSQAHVTPCFGGQLVPNVGSEYPLRHHHGGYGAVDAAQLGHPGTRSPARGPAGCRALGGAEAAGRRGELLITTASKKPVAWHPSTP